MTTKLNIILNSLFWHLLRSAQRPKAGIPNPFVVFDESAPAQELNQLEPSVVGFAVVVWFSAFFGHVNGSHRKSLIIAEKEKETEKEKEVELVRTERSDSVYEDVENGNVNESKLRKSPTDDTLNFFDCEEINEDDSDKTASLSPSRKIELSNDRHNNETVKKLDEQFHFIAHALIEGKFVELSLLSIFLSATNHSDLVGLAYLVIDIWILTNLRNREKLAKVWLKISTFFLLCVFGQYYAVLRIPPIDQGVEQWKVEDGESFGTKLFGGPWCGIFRQHADNNSYNMTKPYGWNEWSTTCIPNTYSAFLTMDFVTLLILSYAYVELQNGVSKPALMSKTFMVGRTRRSVADMLAFLLFVVLPYIILFSVFVVSTLAFNLLTYLYVPIIMSMVVLQSDKNTEHHIGRNERMWKPLLWVALGNVVARLIFQAPVFNPSNNMDSWQVMFGLRKSHSTNDQHLPKLELKIDVIICVLVTFQIIVLRREEISFIVVQKRKLKEGENANGDLIIESIEAVRLDVIQKIRDKFKALNDYMVLVASERNEANEEVNWENYLLKNRILGKQQVSEWRRAERGGGGVGRELKETLTLTKLTKSISRRS